MDHVAIMNKSWHLIPKIVSGEKTIESRWYQTKRAPWDKAKVGETIYFKNSGEAVTTSATISKVLQFSLTSLADTKAVVEKYGEAICLLNRDPATWDKSPKYCILLFLKDPKLLPHPFHIDKKGFGISSAWMVVEDIGKIKVK